MLHFSLYLSGEKVADELADHEDEAAAFLNALQRDAREDFAERVAEYLDGPERQAVAAFLIVLAEKIGGAE